MRLISLSLRQWRCFEECDIEFPDGLIGIRGANGAGKSTIAEAVGWALFGKLRHRAKVGDLRRQGAPKGAKSSVELEFQLGSASYRIERFVGGDARLWINGTLETEKSTATNARVAQELDLTWEVFERTVFAQQKDVAALDPGATGPQRKAHVERLLGLERYRRAAERARSEAKTRSSEVKGLRELAPDPNAVGELLRDAEEKAAEGDPAVATASDAHEEATRQRDQAAATRDAEEGRAREHGVLRQQERTCLDALEKASETLALVNVKLEERKTQAERLAVIEPEAASRTALEAKLRKWDELEEVAGELSATDAQLGALDYDPKQAEVEHTQLAEIRDEQTRLLEQRPRLASAVADATARLKALKAVAKAGVPDDRKLAVDEGEAELREARERLTIARNELEHDRAHVGDVETGGPETPCPICRKPYGSEHEEILAGYLARITKNERQVPKLEKVCSKLERSLERAREALTAAETAAARIADTAGEDDPDAASGKLEAAQAELERVDQRLAELAEHIPVLNQASRESEQLRAQWQELTATKKALATRAGRALKVLDIEAYDPKTHALARGELERITQLDEEACELRETLADLPHLETQRDDLSTQLTQTQTTLKQAQDALAALAFDTDALEALKQQVRDRETLRDDAQAQLTAAKLEAQNRSQEVKELRARLDEARTAQKAIADRLTDMRQYEVAAMLLSKYRDEQAQRAWPRLEEGASTLLNAATDGRYADIKLSQDYRLAIVDRGEEHDLARFSGGEQDLANLCLRLAIADWVSKERNVDLGFVILDEVFGSQDEERRQRLLGELHVLSNRFRQMLVITHLPEIAELCDEQLEVTIAEPGRSLVAIS